MNAPPGKPTDVRDAMTERLLRDAGIGPGMRVVDVGSGRGDVTFMIARLVGVDGGVLGVDRESGGLAVARERAEALGLSNVSFVERDFMALGSEHGTFDAAVGRRVLMYQRDPVDAVQKLATVVRAGGLVIFQEQDTTMVPASVVPLPLHARVHAWIWRAVELEGANLHMGFDLAPVFEKAGLTVEEVRAEAVVQRPNARGMLSTIVRVMLPRIVHAGVATEAEIDVDTLDQRLFDEMAKDNATYIGDMVFGAWGRKPA